MVQERNKIEEKDNKKPFWKELISYVILIAIVLIIKRYVVSPIRVNGESMVPTLEDRDYMILNKIGYRFGNIKRFDIVVISYDGEYLIKRVIGLPGEKIEYKNNKLYVNGKYVKEEYTRKEMDDYNIEQLGEVEVPEDCYFVLGDNRPISKDSRIIGFIKRDDIMGKTLVTILPLSRFGSKR